MGPGEPDAQVVQVSRVQCVCMYVYMYMEVCSRGPGRGECVCPGEPGPCSDIMSYLFLK